MFIFCGWFCTQISDSVHPLVSDVPVIQDFLSLQYACYCMAFICVLGGGFFLFNSIHVVYDRKKADHYIGNY